jgi:hypothetical protein
VYLHPLASLTERQAWVSFSKILCTRMSLVVLILLPQAASRGNVPLEHVFSGPNLCWKMRRGGGVDHPGRWTHPRVLHWLDTKMWRCYMRASWTEVSKLYYYEPLSEEILDPQGQRHKPREYDDEFCSETLLLLRLKQASQSYAYDKVLPATCRFR